jgi:hypothetical protein
MRQFPGFAGLLVGLHLACPAWAGEAPLPPGVGEKPTPPVEAPAEAAPPVPACPVIPACPACPSPMPLATKPQPLYVTDWGRLAALTQEDRRVFSLADAHAQRLDHAYLAGGIGVTLGAGAGLLGLFGRLTDDHWTTASTWGTLGGVSTAVLSALIAWTIAPKRDDFYTVVNAWNLRHPDRPLAP